MQSISEFTIWILAHSFSVNLHVLLFKKDIALSNIPVISPSTFIHLLKCSYLILDKRYKIFLIFSFTKFNLICLYKLFIFPYTYSVVTIILCCLCLICIPSSLLQYKPYSLWAFLPPQAQNKVRSYPITF